MAVAPVQCEPILKGDRFADRLAEICRVLPEVSPLDGLKYRRILIPGIVGGEMHFALLGFIAHALRMRGAEVTGLLCDAFLPACTLKKVDHHESACERWCHRNSGRFSRAARLPHRWYSDFIAPNEVEKCERIARGVSPVELTAFGWRDIDLGVLVRRSVESFFKVGRFDLENPEMVEKGRAFLTSAMCLTLIGERALETLRIDKVFMDDGEKTDWGVFRAVARRHGIPVDVTPGTPRGGCRFFLHDGLVGSTDPMPYWPQFADTPLSESQEAELDEYFETRATRPYDDRSWTSTSATLDSDAIRERIGLPVRSSGLTFAIFPNLSYDAALTAVQPAYDTAAEWVARTIRFFRSRPQHTLVVKVHPSEHLSQPLDPTIEFLASEFDVLPGNVRVIEPETRLTAHDVLAVSDIALVYTSTVGVEAAYFGKRVVNAGGGWHAGRGVSLDVNTPEQYHEVLNDLCSGRISPSTPRDVARRYAYTVFFRGVLPLGHFSFMFPNVTAVNLNSLEDLAPGKDPTMDIICRGILLDEPFLRS